jgi:signal peptidase I
VAPSVSVPRPGTRRRRRGTAAALAVVLLLLVLRAWVAEPLRIPSASMSPTLRPGEHVLAEKVSSHVRSWHRGDVVVFASPVDGELLVKRVVGIGGDLVGLEDGLLVVNGRRIDEPYTDPDALDSVYYGPVRVPAGEVLVMGDNRDNSVDSRKFGPVPTSQIEGRVAAVLWPPDQAHLIDNEGGLS